MSIYIIAEIGINALGNLELAERMIHEAKACGASAAKFQMRTVEDVYTPEELAQPRESPFGKTNGDLKRGLEFSVEDYHQIDEIARFFEIDWSASVWDVKSVDRLMAFDPPWVKIPSALITNMALLEKVYNTSCPVILSTGMSTEQEIEVAMNQFDFLDENLTVLHSTSSYPCPLDELNLSYIPRLKYLVDDDGEPYLHRTGFSSHSVSPWPCLMAACLGAEVIEAHFTLDRSSWGSDQASSLEPRAFKKMVEEIRTWEMAKGDGVKKVYDSELPIKKKLRR